MREETRRRLQTVLETAVARGEIAGGVLAVEEQGRPVCRLAAGYADREAAVPMRCDHIFRLYSMTKPLTAAAAMVLMERGLLDLCEPVAAYLPSFRGPRVRDAAGREAPAAREVLVRDLLDMTAGLMYPDHPAPAAAGTAALFGELMARLHGDDPMTTAELAARLGAAPLAFSPGESWLYGLEADVLGAVLEAAADMPFAELLHRTLLDPLEMHDTDFYVPPDRQARLARVYEAAPDGLRLYRGDHLGIRNAMDRPPAFASGGAGLASTAEDYLKFARMLLQGGVWAGRAILQPATVRFFTAGGLRPGPQRAFERAMPHLSGYTYGNLMRVRRSDAGACFPGNAGEYGWDGWLGCYFSNDPQAGRSLVFMTQRRDAGTLPVVRRLHNVLYTAARADGE